jgi:23S rRNA pseudouridine2457 synthase
MPRRKFIYYKIYKPYGMLSQFSDSKRRETLKNLYNFPENVYPVGRLDSDSEGLLLLTDDKSLTAFLLNPANNHKREYLVQVEGLPKEEELEPIRMGIIIQGIKTKPANAEIIPAPLLPARIPSVRFRKNVPESWLRIILKEGKNRQVRKMTAAIGFPTLRLVRVRIENISLDKMNPGDVKRLSDAEINQLLKNKMAVK